MLHNLPLREAIWIFPLAVTIHFLEERPGFSAWARRFLSPRYTQEHWVRIHRAGLLFALIAAGIISLYPQPWLVFVVLAVFVCPMFFNVLFHAGATVLFRSYAPGLGTAVVVVLPVVWYLSLIAVEQGLISPVWCLAALVVARMVHTLDIYTTVLFRFSKNESAMPGV